MQSICRKIFFIFSCCVILGAAYADNTAPKPALNNPAVGSRAGSNQVFGNPKSTKAPNNKLYDGNQKELNNPTVGSRSGSEQVFGHQPVQRKPSDGAQTGSQTKPWQIQQKQKTRNSPTVGSRSGSEQVFGHP